MSTSAHFKFDGGAATYWGTFLLAALVTLVTIGIAYPWALCMKQRWIAKHTIIDGRRLRFTAGGMNLFGHWLLWWLAAVRVEGEPICRREVERAHSAEPRRQMVVDELAIALGSLRPHLRRNLKVEPALENVGHREALDVDGALPLDLGDEGDQRLTRTAYAAGAHLTVATRVDAAQATVVCDARLSGQVHDELPPAAAELAHMTAESRRHEPMLRRPE